MSVVTNIVLSLGNLDTGHTMGKIVEVNRFFEGYSTPLVSVDDPLLPRGWYGGSKYLEAELFIGAYNAFDIEAFIAHLRSIEWERPESVQLFIMEQEDYRFRLINIIDETA